MKIRSLYNLVFRRKTFDNAASFIDRDNIRAFLQGHIRWFMQQHNSLPKFIAEQASIRLTLADKECIKSDQCKACGCFPMADKVLEDRGCVNGCYGDMLNEKDWELFKVNNNIKF